MADDLRQLQLRLPDDLAERLARECDRLGKSRQDRVLEILSTAVAPLENLAPGAMQRGLSTLKALIERIPGVQSASTSAPTEPLWSIEFHIDLRSRFAWNVVQELGFVLNNLSVEELLPTVFMPVSPPPYLNGGPDEFLGWVIEAKIPFLDAGVIAEILEARLPQPVDSEQAWCAD
jgi:predicted DNA-binding protein